LRRDQDDKRWKDTRAKVYKRDTRCRLLRVITPREYLELSRNAGPTRMTLMDPAHFKPVSSHPEFCYDVDNIVLLNRFSHEMLDSCKDPLSGKSITLEEREAWWKKILKSNKKQYEALIKKGLIEGEEDGRVSEQDS